MARVQCLNCNKLISVKEIKKNINALCKECGCLQRCIYKEGYESSWKIMNKLDLNNDEEE